MTDRCRCFKKAPPEVLEHPERHDYTINFILADFFGIVKEAYLTMSVKISSLEVENIKRVKAVKL